MTELDALWAEACDGRQDVFADWMGRVERPIRRSLAPFSHVVDAEGVVQETLLRMWMFATDRGRTLEGQHASLRFALGMARNIARNEARKRGREIVLPPEALLDEAAKPEAPPDPLLRQAIHRCLERIAKRPLAALMARLEQGHLLPDARLAERTGMSANTFLQNIVRARKQLAGCLERAGISIQEAVS